MTPLRPLERALLLLTLCAALLGAACDSGGGALSTPGTTAGGPAGAALRSEGTLVVFLGDSLTAGLGLPEDEAYPARIAALAQAEGRGLRVVNAGVSGDTSAGGLARLSWLLSQGPGVVVVALGANDGLRGLPVEALERNLAEIVRRARESGARVLLAGMQMPPNYGSDYAEAFREVYPRVARDLDVPLVPFLLEGVGGVGALNQADGIHPNSDGQARLAATVWKHLSKLVPEQ